MKQHLLGILLAVAACFGVHHPTLAQNTKDIVDRLNTSLGVSLPSQYQTTVKNFVKNSKILSDKDAQTFTEQFIKDQMKTSWGINKQNQLLFVWDAVYGQILNNKQLYTGEDGNHARLDEFEKVMEKAEACGKKYKEGFHAYMEQKSAEAKQRSAKTDSMSLVNNLKKISESLEKLSSSIEKYSTIIDEDHLGKEAIEVLSDYKNKKMALEERTIRFKSRMSNKQNHTSSEIDSLLNISKKLLSDISNLRSEVADRRSAEYDRRSAEATRTGLNELIRFYTLYKRNPSNVKPEEIKAAKGHAKWIIPNCKKYNIDYKSKLSPEIRKFYGIE